MRIVWDSKRSGGVCVFKGVGCLQMAESSWGWVSRWEDEATAMWVRKGRLTGLISRLFTIGREPTTPFTKGVFQICSTCVMDIGGAYSEPFPATKKTKRQKPMLMHINSPRFFVGPSIEFLFQF